MHVLNGTYTTIVKVADHVLKGAIALKMHALDDSCRFCKKERPLMMLVLKFAVVDDIAERSIAESGWGDGKSIIKLAFYRVEGILSNIVFWYLSKSRNIGIVVDEGMDKLADGCAVIWR